MVMKISGPTIVESVGSKPKTIEEFVGKVNTQTNSLSIARMKSPPGWEEPGQTPEFDEFTIVLQGTLQVKTKTETLAIHQGEGIIASAGEWVQYSTPGPQGAEYIAVCLPAFSPQTVHRDK